MFPVHGICFQPSSASKKLRAKQDQLTSKMNAS